MAAAESGSPCPEEEEEKEEAEPEGGVGTGAGPPPAPPVPGVLYLSFLPPGFGPRQARALLGVHGELGRVFLQPRGGGVRRRRQRPGPPGGSFAEGWVEFRDKRAAKRAASILHGAPMSLRPRSPFRHHCWSIKYLPGFRWPHLSERLSYERQVRAQRLRVEVAQAKREGGFYTRRPPPPPTDPAPPPPGAPPPPSWGFTQTPTEEEIWGRKKQPPPARPPRSLLQKVFGGGA
ncbi:LOW QUALITY PROTEIN: activator of basal transcription 1 [Melopsittacus undulatus]|uniref:LOW QUALITY PROTEIN: activator of basal transcription 1 n=1 Tax=Melopsittacus undulatus TaxID=13146 RepID=UPI00146BF68B|nr:LOW QUALITY PROTEIN: activator of basal transcription 1 [Melopsittacus undulatus]